MAFCAAGSRQALQQHSRCQSGCPGRRPGRLAPLGASASVGGRNSLVQSGSSLVLSFQKIWRNQGWVPVLPTANLLCSLEKAGLPGSGVGRLLSDKVLYVSRVRKGRGTGAQLRWNPRQQDWFSSHEGVNQMPVLMPYVWMEEKHGDRVSSDFSRDEGCYLPWAGDSWPVSPE